MSSGSSLSHLRLLQAGSLSPRFAFSSCSQLPLAPSGRGKEERRCSRWLSKATGPGQLGTPRGLLISLSHAGPQTVPRSDGQGVETGRCQVARVGEQCMPGKPDTAWPAFTMITCFQWKENFGGRKGRCALLVCTR